MAIGEEIKRNRKRQGLTQKKLAELTGIAEITIRQYEAGKYAPKLEQVKKIAAALNVPLGEFYTVEQLQERRLDAANNGLYAMLETLFDNVVFDWHCTVDRDGVPEYDGDFTVTLTKKGEPEKYLSKREWEILFGYVRGGIPAHINFIEQQRD